ncbi:MAG: WD40 repeat domain-containing protein [SAR324 cluster bacterium]|nr:WD40 repeat domain-containing protein [SAR324 cluster bacterium]
MINYESTMQYVKFVKILFVSLTKSARNSWVTFLLFFACFCWSFASLAQEVVAGKHKGIYLLSQSMKLGKKPVQGAFISADNQRVVVLSGNSSLEIYRTQSGKRQRVISSQEQKAISLVLHPGGKLAITGGQDETVRIWDTQQTTALGVLRGHLSTVSTLALNIGGEILASGSQDGTVILWKMQGQEMLKSAKLISKGSIKSLAFHPQENILAVGGEDGSLQFRSVPELKLISTLPAHKNSVAAGEFNTRGDVFVSASQDGKLIIWDWKIKKQRSVIEFEDAVTDLKIHPKRQEIAVGTAGGNFEIWSLEKGEQLHNINKFESELTQVAFDNNGQRIISALENGSVHIWEYGASLHLQTLSGHERTVESLEFSADSKRLISSAADKSVRIWKLESKEVPEKFEMGTHRVQDVRFVPGSQDFATAGTGSSVIIWNAKDGSRIRELKFHKGKVNALSFHPQDPVLLTAGSDKQWALWNLDSGKLLHSRRGHASQILTTAFSTDGKSFATAGSDLSIILWKYPQGEPLIKLKGHTKAVTTVAFSSDGKMLASGAQDNQIILWKLKPEISKTPLRKLEGHGFIVNQVLFTKDGKALISISKDKTARLWEIKSGKMLRILHGDRTPLVAAAMSPDGKLIALSNLTKDILILKFPNDIPELQETAGDSLSRDVANSAETQAADTALNDAENSVIDLTDLSEKEKQPMTAEELLAYAVPETDKLSADYLQQQKRLNQLLKSKNTCLHIAEMEKLALKILSIIPNDLAAYHAMLKSSILKRDFTNMHLLVRAGNFAELDSERYDYLSILEIRNIFDNLRIDVFDQSFERRGNKQQIKLTNCEGKSEPVSLGEISRNLRYPDEFLIKITSTARLLDLRDFIGLGEVEFQNRMFAEIKRVIDSGTPHASSRMAMATQERAEEIPTGMLKINLEKAQTWKNEGMTAFRLRKESGPWKTYHSDQDNRIIMHLPAGAYYLKVGGILRKTFFLIAGTQLDLAVE